jgi:hybrid cluster-associated redox disulfide protein
MEITKDAIIADALKIGNTMAMVEVLRGYGMHCLGCALAKRETIEQAALSHGANLEEMLVDLNNASMS